MAITLVGLSTYDEGLGVTSDTLINDLTALSLLSGDLLVMEGWGWYSGGAAGTLAMEPGSGEGWVSIGQSTEDSGRKILQIWAKRWGDGGQTDDTTPELLMSAAVSSQIQARTSVWRGTNPGGTAAMAVEAFLASSTNFTTTMSAPSVTTLGADRMVLRAFGSVDDNTHANPSSGGTLGFSHNTSNGTSAFSFSYQAQASAGATGTRTMTQTTNGSDLACTATFALVPPPPPVTITIAATLPVMAGAANINLGPVPLPAGGRRQLRIPFSKKV